MTDSRNRSRHHDATRASFSKQAEDFSRSRVMTDAEGLARLASWLRVTGAERVLDVACGPGIVAGALAPRARHVVGVDLTPAMLARGVLIARRHGARNVAFVDGDAGELPFPARSFDRVVSRRAFHHFPNPETVLREMTRVCAPSGVIVIEDQAPPDDPHAADVMTEIDRLRDPSHTRAIDPGAWLAMLAAFGFALEDVEVIPYELDVDEWMTRAHPEPVDEVRARTLLDSAARGEIPGLRVRSTGGKLRLTVGLQILRAAPPVL